MGRVLRYLIYLGVLAGAGLAIYALVVDLPAPVREMTINVPLPADR